MEDFWNSVLQFSLTTTETVGKQLIKDFGKLQATRKEDGSLVTQADKWADREIIKAITTTFPHHGVLSEETQQVLPDKDWCWVVDPIDGTTNFTRGVPIWGISLGLLYGGTPIFGLVHLPQLNQSFYGYWYGDSGLTGPTGAYLNHSPIHTSRDNPSNSHLFNICARSTAIFKQPFDDPQDKPFPCKIRAIGVATYNTLLVACGAAIGGVEATPKIWDIAAVWAIVQAAGGAFISLESEPIFPLEKGKNYATRPFPSLVLSRQELVPQFKPLVQFLGD